MFKLHLAGGGGGGEGDPINVLLTYISSIISPPFLKNEVNIVMIFIYHLTIPDIQLVLNNCRMRKPIYINCCSNAVLFNNEF